MSEEDKTIPDLPLPMPHGNPTPPGVQPYERKVTPNPDKPKLRKKTEERIAPADEKSARGYDAIEKAGELVTAFKQQIEDGQVVVQMEISDTAVHRLKKI
jgi:hypothetical protein